MERSRYAGRITATLVTARVWGGLLNVELRMSNYECAVRSFSYLEPGVDYQPFVLADEHERVAPHLVSLTDPEEQRIERLLKEHMMISLHEHLGVFPDDMDQTPAYVREGRMATGFRGLAHAVGEDAKMFVERDHHVLFEEAFDALFFGVGERHLVEIG